MADSRAWREEMEDLAAHVWTNRKASPPEIREEIRKAVGVTVPEDEEDALAPLSDEEVRSVLQKLHITSDDVETASDLCPECFARAGECRPSCGQYEEDEGGLYDPPSDEKGMEDLLEEALTEKLSDLCGGCSNPHWNIRSFEDAMILTKNKGLVLKIGDNEFQLTIVRSK
jgi:hypothetical protein